MNPPGRSRSLKDATRRPRPADQRDGAHIRHAAAVADEAPRPRTGGAGPVITDITRRLETFDRLDPADPRNRSNQDRLEHLHALLDITQYCVTHEEPPYDTLIAIAAQAATWATILRAQPPRPS